MNAAVLALCVFAFFAVGYRFYSKFLSERIFALADDEPVPSRTLEDGVDFVPTRKDVLWGHHFTSIAGAAPIVGPAIAVIWGWLPALLWVALGTVMMGAVHDFSALVISLRHRGSSIGEIAGQVISPRVRTLFLLIVSFLIWIVLAVFAFIIGTLFTQYPGAIFPINVQIIVAMLLGWLVYRRGVDILPPSLVAFAVLLTAVFFGNSFAEAFPAVTSISVTGWVWILLIYSFIASVLPVWLLLQPRDYLNAHQLLTGLALLTLGLIVLQPAIVAPAINPNPVGAPPMIPFLFITIACGAISGFHGLVSSGTTSKQIGCAKDARAIGYGGMLGEGALGMLAVLASTAGFLTFEEWSAHYGSWGAANGLGAKLSAFVDGGARFVSSLGIPTETAATFIAVMVIAFAATSLDTGARIQRLVISELAEAYGWKALTNRFAAGAVGISAALVLAVTQAGGQGGLILWPLFGTTNQLVAGVTLLVVSVWLRKQGKPVVYTVVPMVLVGLATVVAMTGEVIGYYQAFSERWLLAISGSIILVLDVWVMLEGLKVLLAARPDARAPEPA
ncbi:MAG: carbon starvation protein A [Deltaproteobacteria bacterium]|nr:carbon starvation protein A [Deltaproteobacteria bacterium]MBW2395978.1 carbon starvation protein A [Deltaproteobacteria bacterium]